MSHVTIVPDARAESLLRQLDGSSTICYFLDEDFRRFLALRSEFDGRLEVRNLSGVYYQTFHEMAGAFLDLMAKLNEAHDSREWWGSQLASKSPESSEVQKLITRLFCARKLLSENESCLAFVTDNQPLSESISRVGNRQGRSVTNHFGILDAVLSRLRLFGRYSAQVLFYVQQVLMNKWFVWRHLKRPDHKNGARKKRILIRSWVSEGNFSQSGEFSDRNFGILPAWLEDRGFEVWTLPMFFNLGSKKRHIYRILQQQKQTFVVPEHYLSFRDYVVNLLASVRMLWTRIQVCEIAEVDVMPIFKAVIRDKGIDSSMAILNLCYPLLRRLKLKGVELEGFYYAFENNAPEKPFILGCREYYEHARLVGFQHTAAYYPDNTVLRLSPREVAHHPLPDVVVCSGTQYVRVLESAGFPEDRLVLGPNLRYGDVYRDPETRRNLESGSKRLLLPFTFSQELAFDLLYKTWQAVGRDEQFRIFIRTHPLLSGRQLAGFVEENDLTGVTHANDGRIQERLDESFAVVSTGGSITILEAVVQGVPVIRVIPDNTFLLDPLFWDDYPLQPVSEPEGIREQLDIIARIKAEDDGFFGRLGKEVSAAYFAPPDDQNMEIFDLTSAHWPVAGVD